MTRLLVLSVQRILKNLRKIRAEVLHGGKGAFDARYQGREVWRGSLEEREEESQEK